MSNEIEIVLNSSSNTSWVVWITIAIAFFALITTIYFSIKNLKLTKIVTLINVIAGELSTDEARSDRKLIRELNKQPMDEIKKLIIWGRDKNNTHREAECGRAIERTISSLDRIGFFLLGDGKKPYPKPPIWLWTHINEAWEKVGGWVENRQKPESQEFYHKNYGYYFQQLEEYRKKHGL